MIISLFIKKIMLDNPMARLWMKWSNTFRASGSCFWIRSMNWSMSVNGVRRLRLISSNRAWSEQYCSQQPYFPQEH